MPFVDRKIYISLGKYLFAATKAKVGFFSGKYVDSIFNVFHDY